MTDILPYNKSNVCFKISKFLWDLVQTLELTTWKQGMDSPAGLEPGCVAEPIISLILFPVRVFVSLLYSVALELLHLKEIIF